MFSGPVIPTSDKCEIMRRVESHKKELFGYKICKIAGIALCVIVALATATFLALSIAGIMPNLLAHPIGVAGSLGLLLLTTAICYSIRATNKVMNHCLVKELTDKSIGEFFQELTNLLENIKSGDGKSRKMQLAMLNKALSKLANGELTPSFRLASEFKKFLLSNFDYIGTQAGRATAAQLVKRCSRVIDNVFEARSCHDGKILPLIDLLLFKRDLRQIDNGLWGSFIYYIDRTKEIINSQVERIGSEPDSPRESLNYLPQAIEELERRGIHVSEETKQRLKEKREEILKNLSMESSYELVTCGEENFTQLSTDISRCDFSVVLETGSQIPTPNFYKLLFCGKMFDKLRGLAIEKLPESVEQMAIKILRDAHLDRNQERLIVDALIKKQQNSALEILNFIKNRLEANYYQPLTPEQERKVLKACNDLKAKFFDNLFVRINTFIEGLLTETEGAPPQLKDDLQNRVRSFLTSLGINEESERQEMEAFIRKQYASSSKTEAGSPLSVYEVIDDEYIVRRIHQGINDEFSACLDKVKYLPEIGCQLSLPQRASCVFDKASKTFKSTLEGYVIEHPGDKPDQILARVHITQTVDFSKSVPIIKITIKQTG